jgi:CRISPR-associated protein Cmr4
MNENDGNHQATSLLMLHAQTALHPGSGTALGVVDLPVQRERHTQWPLIPGSSLKGVLRDACRRSGASETDVFAAFGPETNQAEKHAGALALTDARILAFPVRSLKGVFAWVTCNAVLERFNRDLALAQMPPLPPLETPGENSAICPAVTPLALGDGQLVLEEFEFAITGDSGPLAQVLARRAFGQNDSGTRSSFGQRLAVLNDNDFTHFVRHATEIVARIGLNYETKTVDKGALFYQEFLPTETVMYAIVFANNSRREDDGRRASEMLAFLREHLPGILQIGGDETTGKGLCAVRLNDSEEVAT